MAASSDRRRRTAAALAVLLVGASLVGAPVTMADWGEQATFSAEPVAEAGEEVPVLRYGNLSPAARRAVRLAVEAPDRSHTVYGSEDWPDRFFYSDYAAPGQGLYVVVYEGQHYRLTTHAGGGFPFVYWLYELPFVVYGLGLVGVAAGTHRGRVRLRRALLAGAAGAGFHLLGPELDFPLLAPGQFVGLGVLAAAALVGGGVLRIGRE